MASKNKFKPEITRVRLNPEQAVLTCSCHDGQMPGGAHHMNFMVMISACYGKSIFPQPGCNQMTGLNNGQIQGSGASVSS